MTLLLFAFGPKPAGAHSILLSPTGTPRDYELARAAMNRLAPGDTLVFGSGRFDWSANVTDTLAASGLPGGLAVTRPRLTIFGRPGAVLCGAGSADGQPQTMRHGTNAAFRNAPGAEGMAITGLTLERFENGIVLIQADTLSGARPITAMKDGSSGWRIENLTFRDCFFGIVANGRHRDLAVRRCIFRMRLWNEGKGRVGSFAVSVRPLPPLYRGLPYKIEVDENEIHGPADKLADGAFSGIVVTADSARITRNEISDYRIGIVAEGRGAIVGRNTISGGSIGIVAWTTGGPATQSIGAFVVKNEVRGMSRQPTGFLTGFSGSGILLAGLKDSEIAGNKLEQNVAADIVFGGVRSTTTSSGNRVRDNLGSVLLSPESDRLNHVQTGQKIVREIHKPGEPLNPSKPAKPAPPAGQSAPAGRQEPAATPPKGGGGRP